MTAAASSGERQRAIVVLGPGRCGTSTLARGLITLGVAFGDRLKPAMRKNPRGFFEDLDLLHVNYRAHARLRLRRNGSSIGWIADQAWRDADLAPLRKEAKHLISRRFGGSPVWGFKVGGVMRILPFWEQVLAELDQDVSYVLAIRHPASVAKSRQKLDPRRGLQEKSDLEFAAQILPFSELMTRRPYVVVDYDRLIAAPANELQRIARHLQLPVSSEALRAIDRYAAEFVSVGFRHDQAAERNGDGINPLTWSLYRRLLDLASDASAPADPDIALDLAQLALRFKAMSTTLALVDELEGELRRRGPSLRGLAMAAWKHLPTAATLADLRMLLKARSSDRDAPRRHHAIGR
jgi:hypothetical protein